MLFKILKNKVILQNEYDGALYTIAHSFSDHLVHGKAEQPLCQLTQPKISHCLHLAAVPLLMVSPYHQRANTALPIKFIHLLIELFENLFSCTSSQPIQLAQFHSIPLRLCMSKAICFSTTSPLYGRYVAFCDPNPTHIPIRPVVIQLTWVGKGDRGKRIDFLFQHEKAFD